MKNLKLLNKKLLLIILFFLFLAHGSSSEEPVDIWNLETNQKVIKDKNSEVDSISQNDIYNLQY